MMRVQFVRIDNRRRLRLARRLAARNWPRSLIALACRLPRVAIDRELDRASGGLWGRHAGLIESEMARSS